MTSAAILLPISLGAFMLLAVAMMLYNDRQLSDFLASIRVRISNRSRRAPVREEENQVHIAQILAWLAWLLVVGVILAIVIEYL